MKLETVPLGSISFDPANTRKHSRRNLDAIKASLRRFGQQKPIVVDAKGVVLAGNGTLAAATELGWSEIQIVRTALAGVDATAFGIADNRTAELAEWDDKLGDVLAALKAEDFPLAEIGFDEADLAELAGEPEPSDADAEPQIDKAEELRAKWGVQLGQIWELGDHKILCGDSTEKEHVERLMNGEKAEAAITDPPFAIMGSSTGAKNDASLIRPFFRIFWQSIQISGAVDVYMFCDWRSFPTIHQEAKGYDIKDVIVWDKQSGGLGNPYRRRHEFIVFARPAESDKVMFKKATNCRSITDDDVWAQPRVNDKEHNAQKPIELIVRCLKNSTDTGSIIFEPCSGSGTTIIACERTGRKCRAIELNPAYVAVAIQRWADATGKEPRKL